MAYSVGLTGLILVKVLAPGFYSRQDIRTPVKIALIRLSLTQVMNLAFIGWLKHAGLALSIGLASCANAFLLWRGLRQRQAYSPAPGWLGFMIRLLLALAVMSAVLWFGAGDTTRWLRMDTVTKLTHLGWLIPAGAVSYFLMLGLLGFRLGDFKRQAMR